MTGVSIPTLVCDDINDHSDDRASASKVSDRPPKLSLPQRSFQASPIRITGSTFKSWEDKQAMTPWENIEIPHFPDLEQDGLVRTSEPISQGVESSEELEVMDLVTRDKLRELLSAPMGMVRFSEWVQEEGQAGSSALLRYYKDVRAQTKLVQEVKSISQGLDATYFHLSDDVAGFSRLTTNPTQCLPALSSALLQMSSAEEEVLGRLYAREFKRFISGKLIEQASACLGAFADLADRGDLGEIYCLADPRQRDTPLVFVSDGFCQLSEYPRSRLIGRNCRFLQGPGTDPEAVRLLKEALQAGREHTSLLLNYTRTGKPFWNLFTMIPLRNTAGEIDYFLGAQINVNRALTSRETFGALTGMSEKGRELSSSDGLGIDFSEDVLSAAEKQGKSPTVIRQINASHTKSPPMTTLAVPDSPLLAPESPSLGATARNPPKGKLQRWYSELRTRKSVLDLKRGVSSENVKPSSSTSSRNDGSENGDVNTIQQEVEQPIKEHMANFASAYSKIIVFGASDRKMTHVTPALLSFLGYPIKTDKDRFSPPMLGADFLTLLADASPAVTKVTRQVVAKSVGERAPHSFFTGLKMYDDRSSTAPRSDEVTASGAPFVRGLLHLTPVKDIKDVVHKYVLLVG